MYLALRQENYDDSPSGSQPTETSATRDTGGFSGCISAFLFRLLPPVVWAIFSHELGPRSACRIENAAFPIFGIGRDYTERYCSLMKQHVAEFQRNEAYSEKRYPSDNAE
jgi:hypothetical protein